MATRTRHHRRAVDRRRGHGGRPWAHWHRVRDRGRVVRDPDERAAARARSGPEVSSTPDAEPEEAMRALLVQIEALATQQLQLLYKLRQLSRMSPQSEN